MHAKQHALMRLLFSLLLRCSFLVSAHPPHFASRLVGIQASFHPTTNTPLLLFSSNPGTVQTLNTLMVDEPARRAARVLVVCRRAYDTLRPTHVHARLTVYSGCRTTHDGMQRLSVYFVSSRFAPDSSLAMTCSHGMAWGIIGRSIPAGKC